MHGLSRRTLFHNSLTQVHLLSQHPGPIPANCPRLQQCQSPPNALDEVVADMNGMMAIPGPDLEYDDWSGDEFEGYVDEPDDEQQQGEGENVVTSEELEIGWECEVSGDHGDIPEYSHSAGCNHDCQNATPLDFFKMLLTDDILDIIVTQTNLYASQFISTHNLSPRSRVHGWSREPFTPDELRKFVALIIVMGLVNLPTLEDHWVTTWPYSSQAYSKVWKTFYT